ncbi:DUF2382 domain-containing protein [Paradesertivirga mongoliensis]|uniref:DUF2382 domain-containing protein n=1 Tax=Paradesertivirga mongoliensis TaxID=2100740 RepID=A0ABW4ZNF5_9SPHI|nr:DUF2382 domain-containing protein [Pedobacter mongoliensis]
MSQTVIGIFDNENEAQQAVQNLVNQGFNREDVDIASRGSSQTETRSDHEDDSFGSSISNFFSSLFGSDDDRTSRYSEVAKRGSTITVHARSEAEAERAADILDQYGAVDIDERANQYGTDHQNKSTEYDRDNIGDYNRSNDSDRSIPIIEENLEIGKREVESGGARLRSRIVEKPVEESVRLRNEHVNVERTPVNRQANESDFESFEEGTIEMREHKEIPVVSKDAWVKEEVSLNKDVEETEETIRDSVRRTEVDIENLNKDEKNSDTWSDLDDDSSVNRDRDRL